MFAAASSRLGPYELRGELGRGAMAIVWRAWDTRLEREVAIKEPVIPSGMVGDAAAEFSERFVREARAAAKLNHPGIVTIYAADVYDSRPAIVMELIEGGTLAGILDRGALSLGASTAILDQLLDAAAYAHSRGVVHRDIKPDNVFLTDDGRVKLADFGIAHVESSSTLTQAGTVMGTPGYMSPEQVTGQPVDSRADIFSIGVIGYEMLTGRNPFGATDGVAPTTVMYRVVHEPVLATEITAAGVPAQVAAVLQAATAKDPGHRFPDAGSFRAALAGGPIPVAPAGTAGALPSAPAAGYPTASAGRPSWLPYAIVGGVGLVVVGALLAFATSGGGAGSSTSGAQSSAVAAGGQTAGAAGNTAGAASPSAQGLPLPPGHPPATGSEGLAPGDPPKVDLSTAALGVLDGYVETTCQRDLTALMALYGGPISPYYGEPKVNFATVRRSKASMLQGKWTKTDIAYSGTPNVRLTGVDTAVVTYDKTWDFSGPSGYYRGAIRAELSIRIVNGVALIFGERDLGDPVWTQKG